MKEMSFELRSCLREIVIVLLHAGQVPELAHKTMPAYNHHTMCSIYYRTHATNTFLHNFPFPLMCKPIFVCLCRVGAGMGSTMEAHPLRQAPRLQHNQMAVVVAATMEVTMDTTMDM